MSTAEVLTTALSGWTEHIKSLGIDVPEALLCTDVDPQISPCPRDTIPLTSFARIAEFVGDHATCANASWAR